jgi:hypothetical protein
MNDFGEFVIVDFLARASEACQIEDAIACSKRVVLQGPRPTFLH